MILREAFIEEQHTIVSGPCIVGRTTSGAGGMEELSGNDVLSFLPDATALSAGKMTAEQAAAVGRLPGIGTTAQRDAISNPQVGDEWFNTDNYVLCKQVYDGTFWRGPNQTVLINRTGADSVVGKTFKISTSDDFSFINPGSDAQIRVAGTVASGGIANGQYCLVNVSGPPKQVLMEANDGTSCGYFLFTSSNGENYSLLGNGNNTAAFGITLESKSLGSPYLVWYIPIAAEVY